MERRAHSKRRRLERETTQVGPAIHRRFMGRTHKPASKKKPYTRTGVKRRTKGSLKGTSFSARYVNPLVHRNIRSHQYTWPLQANPAGGGNMLVPLRVVVPESTWGQYTRGFDICQVTSNGIRSRNCTMRVAVQLPKQAMAAQPFQLRIVQCWIKSTIELPQTSTDGTSGMYDGLVLNFDPDTAWDGRAHQVFADSVGVINGDGMVSGNISSDRVKVIDDKTHTIASSNVDDGGYFVYPTFERRFNFKTGRNMRLLPSTSEDGIPADPLNIKMVPVNQPGLWIPCVAMMFLNATQYTGATDQPGVSITESHYWTDL